MKAHLLYFRYVMRHKWFVFQACLKLGVPIWRAIIHDWSKFTPSEWFPYVHKFFWTDEQRNAENMREAGLVGNIYEAIPFGKLAQDRFTAAWNHHLHANPHHWEYWVVHPAKDTPWGLPIPETYAREMVADWTGAGRAITGETNPLAWYQANKDKMIIRDDTRMFIEKLMNDHFSNTGE